MTSPSPPQPLPERLWGERWRFAALGAGDFFDCFEGRPIPFLNLPEALQPLNLGLASDLPLPGVIIDGGRRALALAKWLAEIQPRQMGYQSADLAQGQGGVILTDAQGERWILATFSDLEMAASGAQFQQRREGAKGLHFLIVQPDNAGVTYSGVWLLRDS
ncbi:MAG: Tab2 family RNA-binding protein [Cyanobacteriota bacterium]|nr:Tab2 family RNA-binding protein [Cyanobacteriota bacterium]